MFIVKSIKTFGSYLLLMRRVFARPESGRIFMRQTMREIFQLGIDSIPIVLLISFFIGAVICIQMKLNIENAWMPKFVVGYATREIMLLEFSSSIMCLILAGKTYCSKNTRYISADLAGRSLHDPLGKCHIFKYISVI